MEHFRNEGFGWVCISCDVDPPEVDDRGRSRLLREGEAEGKVPQLSITALAKWTSADHDALACPKCGITERIT